MGLLSWWKGKKPQPAIADSPKPSSSTSIQNNSVSNGAAPPPPAEVPGMNGAVEVPRPPNATISVFEFGSVAATNDRVTLAGYCPVSEDFEPCRWEIIPAAESNAPLFRVVF